jgi:ribosome-associated protein
VAPDVTVPPVLWNIVERALQKKADNRFSSAAQLREALRVPRKRRPTKPSQAAIERRLEEKRRRSQPKRLRAGDDG